VLQQARAALAVIVENRSVVMHTCLAVPVGVADRVV
jgi:hypothetical protein